MHERSLPEQASELAENEGEEEEEARTAKPSRDPPDPTAADRAMHEAPMCHSVRAPCVSDAATTRRAAGSSMTRTRVPEILIDCYFARRDDETETVTLLVVEDHYSEPSKHGSSSGKAQISMPLMSVNEP